MTAMASAIPGTRLTCAAAVTDARPQIHVNHSTLSGFQLVDTADDTNFLAVGKGFQDRRSGPTRLGFKRTGSNLQLPVLQMGRSR